MKELNVIDVQEALTKGMELFLPLISDVKLETILGSLKCRIKANKKSLKTAKELQDTTYIEMLQLDIASDKILIEKLEKHLAK